MPSVDSQTTGPLLNQPFDNHSWIMFVWPRDVRFALSCLARFDCSRQLALPARGDSHGIDRDETTSLLVLLRVLRKSEVICRPLEVFLDLTIVSERWKEYCNTHARWANGGELAVARQQFCSRLLVHSSLLRYGFGSHG